MHMWEVFKWEFDTHNMPSVCARVFGGILHTFIRVYVGLNCIATRHEITSVSVVFVI